MIIIKDMRVLKALQKRGFVEIHEETNMFGYVRDGKHSFVYKNKTYFTKYFDGCFYPFVITTKK
jgi:hypothetical protein